MNWVDEAKKEVSNGKIVDASIDFFEDFQSALLGDRISLCKLMIALARSPFLIREKMFWAKFEDFLSGLYTSEEDRLRFCAKLAENGKQQENAFRIISYIDRIETKQKAKYLANAGRSLSAGFIVLADFFRICHVITANIDDDLQFLAENIQKDDIEYSIPVQGLMSSGLMHQSYIDGSGYQKYSFTPLADMVDRFSVSFGNIERYPDPTKGQLKAAPQLNIDASMELQEIGKMLESI